MSTCPHVYIDIYVYLSVAFLKLIHDITDSLKQSNGITDSLMGSFKGSFKGFICTIAFLTAIRNINDSLNAISANMAVLKEISNIVDSPKDVLHGINCIEDSHTGIHYGDDSLKGIHYIKDSTKEINDIIGFLKGARKGID